MNFYLYRIKHYSDIDECLIEEAGLTFGETYGEAQERVLEAYGETNTEECELHILAFENIATLEELRDLLESDIDD